MSPPGRSTCKLWGHAARHDTYTYTYDYVRGHATVSLWKNGPIFYCCCWNRPFWKAKQFNFPSDLEVVHPFSAYCSLSLKQLRYSSYDPCFLVVFPLPDRYYRFPRFHCPSQSRARIPLHWRNVFYWLLCLNIDTITSRINRLLKLCCGIIINSTVFWHLSWAPLQVEAILYVYLVNTYGWSTCSRHWLITE